MLVLDELKQIQKLDKSNLLGSVQQLGLQLKQTKEELADLKIPSSYKNVNNIVVNGMGGSRLGARVAQRLFEDSLDIPIYPIGYYDLPKFVNEKTLLIISSYSGNTEEPLNTVQQAFSKKAKILIYSQNGKLTKIAKEKNLPGYYDFTPKYNPSNQPRMSIGYQVLATSLLLAKCGLLKMSGEKIDQLIDFITQVKEKYDVNVSSSKNPAKKTAVKFKARVPVFVAAEHLMGALHVVKNQVNENSKQFNVYFEIPELNHHLLEGMKFPGANPDNLVFFFVKSQLYHPRNQKRIEITKKVLDGYKIKHQEIKLTGKTKIEQVFELIQFGSFVSFYLSMINNIDPTPIPWVDFFKAELKNSI